MSATFSRKRSKSIVAAVRSFFGRQLSVPNEQEPAVPKDESDSSAAKLNESYSFSRKQEVAWMQACYNAVAFLFLFITGCILLAVYYVLESFLHPLLWAVLVGMVLHPFKHVSTSDITQWLKDTQTSGVPLSLAAIFTPLILFNWLSSRFEEMVLRGWKVMTGVVLGVAVLSLVYVANLHVYVFHVLSIVNHGLYLTEYIVIGSVYMLLLTLGLGFFLILVFTKAQPQYATPLKFLSSVLWFLILLNLSIHLLGSVATPFVGLFYAAALILSHVWKRRPHSERRRRRRRNRMGVVTETGTLEKGHYLNILPSISSLYDDIDDDDDDDDDDDIIGDDDVVKDLAAAAKEVKGGGSLPTIIGGGSSRGSETASIASEASGIAETGTKTATASSSSSRGGPRRGSSASSISSVSADVGALEQQDASVGGSSGTLIKRSKDTSIPRSSGSGGGGSVGGASDSLSVCGGGSGGGGSPRLSGRGGRGRTSFRNKSQSRRSDTLRRSGGVNNNSTNNKRREPSNVVFILLLIAYFSVLCWHYPFILFIVVPLLLWALTKHVAAFSSTLASRFQTAARHALSAARERAWLLAPPPLPTMVRMFVYADRAILRVAVRTTGSLVSAFIIIGLVVGVATTLLVLLLKAQAELSHYMTVGAKVWNMTLQSNPQIAQWIQSSQEGNESLPFSFESVAKQSYQYGRVWLAHQIHTFLGDSMEGPSLVEKQILDLFDELYHSYFLDRHATTPNTVSNVWQQASQGQGALFEEIKHITINNYEIILSMLKSLGSIITDNFSVGISFFYAFIQLIFSGGSFLFNMIVFVSTLFYLLSWSDEEYLPVQWVMELLPHLAPPTTTGADDEITNDHLESFQKAIRSVFHASFRRAFFYGLYTWIMHTVLAIPVSILPSVLAAVAGAIPFVGPYWASLPAILELWLVEGSPMSAILLLVFSLLPVLFVDSLINGEIEGGHPYLTGLAIAGGIYFAGLEGALIGPILLCCLLFFMDIYGDVFYN